MPDKQSSVSLYLTQELKASPSITQKECSKDANVASKQSILLARKSAINDTQCPNLHSQHGLALTNWSISSHWFVLQQLPITCSRPCQSVLNTFNHSFLLTMGLQNCCWPCVWLLPFPLRPLAVALSREGQWDHSSPQACTQQVFSKQLKTQKGPFESLLCLK